MPNAVQVIIVERALLYRRGFVATLRQALTGAVYPSVKDASPSPQQLRGMRAALQEIIAALPTVRERLETSYRMLASFSGGSKDQEI